MCLREQSLRSKWHSTLSPSLELIYSCFLPSPTRKKFSVRFVSLHFNPLSLLHSRSRVAPCPKPEYQNLAAILHPLPTPLTRSILSTPPPAGKFSKDRIFSKTLSSGVWQGWGNISNTSVLASHPEVPTACRQFEKIFKFSGFDLNLFLVNQTWGCKYVSVYRMSG